MENIVNSLLLYFKIIKFATKIHVFPRVGMWSVGTWLLNWNYMCIKIWTHKGIHCYIYYSIIYICIPPSYSLSFSLKPIILLNWRRRRKGIKARRESCTSVKIVAENGEHARTRRPESQRDWTLPRPSRRWKWKRVHEDHRKARLLRDRWSQTQPSIRRLLLGHLGE